MPPKTRSPIVSLEDGTVLLRPTSKPRKAQPKRAASSTNPTTKAAPVSKSKPSPRKAPKPKKTSVTSTPKPKKTTPTSTPKASRAKPKNPTPSVPKSKSTKPKPESKKEAAPKDLNVNATTSSALGKRKRTTKEQTTALPPAKKPRNAPKVRNTLPPTTTTTTKRAPVGKFNVQKALEAGILKVGDRFVLEGLKGTQELGGLICCVITKEGKLLTEEPEKQTHDNFTAWINAMLPPGTKSRGGKLKHAIHERTRKNVSELHAELKEHKA